MVGPPRRKGRKRIRTPDYRDDVAQPRRYEARDENPEDGKLLLVYSWGDGMGQAAPGKELQPLAGHSKTPAVRLCTNLEIQDECWMERSRENSDPIAFDGVGRG